MNIPINQSPDRDAVRPATEGMLTTAQAAHYLGLAVSTLNKWRCHGGGPKFLKLGRAVRYRQTDLDTFVAERVLGSTAEAEEGY